MADTGIGIAPEQQQRIFENFAQADDSTTRLYGGTGLGLAICAQLVQLMEGRIWVESEEGQGSTFHFNVRLQEASPPVLASSEGLPATPVPRAPLRILLAEDNPVNQLLATRLLEKEGHVVTVAENGRQALERIAQQLFDLVLMDVEMLEMDGLEVTQAIRQAQKETATHMPIIAMTAHAMQGDRERFLEAGMDDHVTKPIRPRELFQTIERHRPVLARKSARTAADDSGTEGRLDAPHE